MAAMSISLSLLPLSERTTQHSLSQPGGGGGGGAFLT